LPQPGKGPFLNGGKDDESGLYHENAEQSRWFINLSNSKIPRPGATKWLQADNASSQMLMGVSDFRLI
jgi:hypothetical protein